MTNMTTAANDTKVTPRMLISTPSGTNVGYVFLVKESKMLLLLCTAFLIIGDYLLKILFGIIADFYEYIYFIK
jgi:hypothetical protein